MNFPEYNCIGYKSELTHKTAIYNVDQIRGMKLDKTKEHYCTLYRFKQTIKEYESIAGIGPEQTFYADYLAIDLDRDKPSVATSDMLTLSAFLEQHDIGYECYFSGNKGYHIMIPTVQFEFQPTNDIAILREMAVAISQGAGVPIDTKIYNASRVFRMVGSLHKKSDKFKKVYKDGEEYPEPWDYVTNDKLCELHTAIVSKRKSKATSVGVGKGGAIRRLYEAVNKGDRNDQAYKHVKRFREMEMTQDDVLVATRLWNTACCHPPLSNKELNNVIKSANVGNIKYPMQKTHLDTFSLNGNSAVESLRKEYQYIDKHAIKTGYDFIDKYTMGFVPGELIFWLAVNGNLKTCILSNLLWRISQNSKKHSLLFSMDMKGTALLMRHIMAAEEKTYKDVRYRLKNGENFPKFESAFKNVHIVDKKSITVEDISKHCERFRDRVGEIGMIGIDYLGTFKGADNDNKVTGECVHDLAALASETSDCPIMCLAQANRAFEGQDGNIEIQKSAGKDTSAIEHKADYVIGSWNHTQPGEEKRYWGRFCKARKFDGEHYKEHAYFSMDFYKPYMLLNDVRYEESPPVFAQKRNYS